MDDFTSDKGHAAPEKAVGRVIFCIGLASLGVLAWAIGKAMPLERPLDVGHAAALSVLAIFGLFCARIGWGLSRSVPEGDGSMEARQSMITAPPRRVRLSHGCAAAGVLLLMLSVLVPAHWYPVVPLFLGLALLAVSHGLTPCEERIAKLRKARELERQL